MNWSAQQEKALKAVATWFRTRTGEQQIYKVFGFAGSGKSTLARHFAEGQNTIFAAYTGKAALVMRQAGCTGARTIHSLIYHPQDKSRRRLRELEEQFQEEAKKKVSDEAVTVQLMHEIAAEKKRLAQPSFYLNEDSDLQDAELLIIDECSMVGDAMAKDLLAFGTPILVLGDPAQLPPVYGTGYFTSVEPDVMLTEIHRQSRDNPIIQLASRVRQGLPLEPGTYGESSVIWRKDSEVRNVDPDRTQVIVGLNATRRSVNARIRRNYLPNIGDVLVAPGEKIICLRNDNTEGLLNGSLWRVQNVLEGGDFLELAIESEDDGRELEVQVHPEHFQNKKPHPGVQRQAQEFDFGYAITAHKAQGSGWPHVVVVDESDVFARHGGAEMGRRHLYTAVTRAIETVQVVI